MKRNVKRIIGFAVVVVAVVTAFPFFLLNPEYPASASAEKRERTTVLLVGLDEVAENTDVMILASVTRDGEISFMQIPRDTYLKDQVTVGKINRIYPSYIAKYGQKRGAEEFLSAISKAFSVQIDAYIVFEESSLAALVDSIGGVTVNAPTTITYVDKEGKLRHIKEGIVTLNGESALAYVRHRSSYLEGDLGRLDAQLRFSASLIEALGKLEGFRDYWRLYQKNSGNLLTNLEERDIINLIKVYLSKKNELAIKMMRLPGEACRTEEGAWYFVLNRDAAGKMLSAYYDGAPPDVFDAAGRFYEKDRLIFSNIYGAKGVKMKVLTPSEASRVKVLHK